MFSFILSQIFSKVGRVLKIVTFTKNSTFSTILFYYAVYSFLLFSIFVQKKKKKSAAVVSRGYLTWNSKLASALYSFIGVDNRLVRVSVCYQRSQSTTFDGVGGEAPWPLYRVWGYEGARDRFSPIRTGLVLERTRGRVVYVTQGN